MSSPFIQVIRRRFPLCTVGLLLMLAGALPAVPPAPATASEPLFALADIHGDFDSLVAILQQAKLIDAQRRWTGGKATLVQTGDFLDRGPKPREVMDLLMELEKQAPKAGGRLVALLGNHEAMNLYGDLRYVTPENYASFADNNSESRRKAAYQEYVQFQTGRAQALNQQPPAFTPETEKEWMEKHPPGFLEHRDAFGPGGKYGRWLRERPAVVQVGAAIFLHGGISPQLTKTTLEQINERIRSEIRAFDNFRQYLVQQKLILPFFTLEEMTRAVQAEVDRRKAEAAPQSQEGKKPDEGQQAKKPEEIKRESEQLQVLEEFLRYPTWFSFHPEGPLWFRGFAESPEEALGPYVSELLAGFGAKHFVVGHTPQRDGRVQVRLAGKVFLIDTGMLASYYPGGRASLLEIRSGKFTAVYRDERVVLLEPVATTPVAEPKPDATGYGGGLEQEPGFSEPALSSRVWIGPNGQPLPFETDEEVLEFLRSARVVSMKDIPKGITRPRKVMLEKDGIRMHAAFRDVDVEKTVAEMAGGQRELMFRDSYIFECAAYELSRLLGLDNVPPVVQRKIEGHSGSLQIWVENAMTEFDRVKQKISPPDAKRWNRQVHQMWIFDNLVYNTDRNQGNILIGPDWKLWMIDHTRAFRRHDDLRDLKGIVDCDRHLWEKLQTLDPELVKQRLKKYLRPAEIDGVLKRHQKVVAHIQRLIAERGESRVLYTMH